MEEEREKLAKYEEQMLDDSALDIPEINPAVRVEARSIAKSEEVAANIIGILKKRSEIEK